MVETHEYHGMVYCASVPNGTLIVRRAGKMLVAGNYYVYARAAAAASGLDRFEERHWRELEKQLGITSGDPPDIADDPSTKTTQATQGLQPSGGLAVSGARDSESRNTGRRLIRSRWLS